MRLLTCVLTTVLLAGCGTPSFLVTPVPNRRGLEVVTVEKGQGWVPKRIAIVEVEGLLINARTNGFLEPTENPLSLFVQELKEAEEDQRVAAVVLRINSPGGTVTASDAMYQELLRFRSKTGKPVIASAQEVCASGAYYVACGADKIVVQPTSVVGSVGVLFNSFDFAGTMEKLGIRNQVVKSGQLKDMGSPFRHSTEEERAVMQRMVDEFFGRFLAVVSANRPISDPEKLKTIGDGRVFSGQDAVKLGLADATGTLQDALQLAKQTTNSPGAAVVLYKRPYGYAGSIYASTRIPPPSMRQPNTLTLNVPGIRDWLPGGFYYLWTPGM